MKTRLGAIVADRRLWTGTAGRVALLLVIMNVIIAWSRAKLEADRAANQLLTSSVDSALLAKGPPRYDASIGGDLARYWQFIPDGRVNRLVYLVGMSQMYKINDPRPGDQTIAEHLDDVFAPRARVFGLAAPNLSNEEVLFLLLSVLNDPRTKPSAFIYSLCFDKMRFVDLRPGYLDFIRKHPAVGDDLIHVANRYADRYPLASAKLRTTLAALNTPTASDDRSFEHRLRTEVAAVVPLVQARKDLNVVVTYGVLYGARNRILGISNTTKRPMIPGRYELNKEFLLLMMDIAQERGVRFVYYINPLNPQAENPYVASEYSAFKQWSEATAAQQNVDFANLEAVVPETAWGLFMGGPDFKHFSGEGHRLTAQAIAQRFGRVLIADVGR